MLRGCVLSFILIAFMSVEARAEQTVYVDADLLCAGMLPCFATLQEGVDNTDPPGQVFVFPGDYAGSNLDSMGSTSGGGAGDIEIIGVDDAGVSGPPTRAAIMSASPAISAGSGGSFPGNIRLEGFILSPPAVPMPGDRAIDVAMDGSLVLVRIVAGSWIRGVGSSIGGDLEIIDSQLNNNVEHGASAVVFGTLRCLRSFLTRNGLSGYSGTVLGDVEITECHLDDNEEAGFGGVVTGTVRITDSSFDRNSRKGVRAGFSAGTSAGVEVTRSSFDGNGGAGLGGSIGGDLRVIDSSFNENARGISINSSRDASVSITGSSIVGSTDGRGLGLFNFAAGGLLECNDIADNVDGGLDASSSGAINAESNWWGSASGPVHPSNPGGTGQEIFDVGELIDPIPFLTGPTDQVACPFEEPTEPDPPSVPASNPLALFVLSLLFVAATALALRPRA